MLKIAILLFALVIVAGEYIGEAALRAQGHRLADTWSVNTDLRDGAESLDWAHDHAWQELKKGCREEYVRVGGKPAPFARSPNDLRDPEIALAWNRENAFLLTCHMTRRIERLCRAEAKDQLVGLLRGHFHNLELDAKAPSESQVTARLVLLLQRRDTRYEAMLAKIRETHGDLPTDLEAGTHRGDEARPQSVPAHLEFAVLQDRFDQALRRLIISGYLTRQDFASFLGLYVPGPIAEAIGDVRPAAEEPCLQRS